MNADTLKALQTAWPYEIPKNWRWTTVGAINQYKGMIVRPDRTPGQRFELYSVPSSASGAYYRKPSIRCWRPESGW